MSPIRIGDRSHHPQRYAPAVDRRRVIEEIFGAPRALIGMIHVQALPGTPRADRPLAEIVEQAVAEAWIYRDAGFHGLAIENMHDRP